ncbi:MAG: SBBP repeat-containing protein [Candidatus Heimdallarchaeota archaeon]
MRLNKRIKITQRMKEIKIYLILLVVILCFSLKLQGIPVLSNKRNENDNRNIIIPSAPSGVVTVQWNRLWGGINYDSGEEIAIDSSNYVYLAGSTTSFGAENSDMLLVKYDSSGLQQWNRTWGGNDQDWGRGVAVDSSNNVYLAGETYSFGAGYIDMILVKYDSSGVQLWNRTWGGSNSDICFETEVDSFDNVYLAGSSTSFGAGSSDIVLVKFDSSGVQQWNRTWGGNNYDWNEGVAVDSSDNVYLAGETNSFGAGSTDMALIKYDSSGVQQWNHTWGGSEHDASEGVAVDSAGNVYFGGATYSFGVGDSDMALVKYDSSGVQQWNRTWGGSGYELNRAIAVDSFDNVYFAGQTSSFGAGESDMALVKYDSSGVQKWSRTWGGNRWETTRGMAVDSADNIYLVGETSSFGAGSTDMALVKYITSNITINFPVQFKSFNSTSPSFDISTFDANLDSTWYTLNGGIVNVTFSGSSGAINQTEWDKHGDGIVFIRFYMNNTAGKEEYVEVAIIKDTTLPEITINNPLPNETFGSDPPDYNISIIEPNFDSMWYKINDNFTNYIVPYDISEVLGRVDQNIWENLHRGKTNITFFVQDKAGNIASVSVVVIKETEPTLEYLPIILTIVIPFIGAAVYIIIRNRRLSKKVQDEIDSI